MRTLLLLLSLSMAPALAHAAVDFKCDSVNYDDQVSGWLRFESNGRSGHVILEYWNGYPPIGLVDADFGEGVKKDAGLEYVSEADRHGGTVATVNVPEGASKTDKFLAKVAMRYTSPETGKLRVMKYDLTCVRH
jgi:hypothetical protein